MGVQLDEIDDRAWPFVVSVMHGRPSEAFFERFYAKQRELLARGEPWVHLVDSRHVNGIPDAKCRQLITDRNREIEAASRELNLGTAVVLKSAIVRGVLTAIHWVSPPPNPMTVVNTIEEGLAYLRRSLELAGVRVPANMQVAWVDEVVRRVLGQG